MTIEDDLKKAEELRSKAEKEIKAGEQNDTIYRQVFFNVASGYLNLSLYYQNRVIIELLKYIKQNN